MDEDGREIVAQVEGLAKTFHIGFFRRKVEAVRQVTFEVRKGEIFGLLGPNGAGKTTTIKVMTSLIFSTRGRVRIFGMDVPDRRIYRRVGYLPENPYFYDYLGPVEYLKFAGSLCGLSAGKRLEVADRLIERVGLADVRSRPLRKFSKGMLQRLGIAQALVNGPGFLILDEPMSGLDPIGRREIRNLILELRDAGTTIMFSSHILSDVEMICDRVAIVNEGVVTSEGALGDLLHPEVRRTVIECEGVSDDLVDSLRETCLRISRAGTYVTLEVEGDRQVDGIVDRIREARGRVVSVVPHRETLEDIFVRDALADRS